nr:hypothetical protein CFP56_58747 [Quercus suber]
MVYRGKLSKACKECRSRKTRCDTAQPGCTQCKRAGRTCSGYRDVQSLRVVDQTNFVTIQQYGPHRAVERSRPPKPKPVPVMPCKTIAPLRPLLEPLNVLNSAAPAMFYAELLNTGSTWTKTDLSWVSVVYGKVEPNGTLADMISTLGIVAYARKSKDHSMMRPATQKYLQVIRRTRAALADPVTAASDEMLATVWLLACGDQTSVHLDGAVRLLRFRGVEQFRTIVMDHLTSSKPIPQDLLELMRTGWEQQFHEVQVGLSLLDLAGRLCTLIAPEKNVQFSDVRAKHQALLDLDGELKLWTTTLGESFTFSRIIATDDCFPREYDLYSSHVSAVIINEYRRVRIHTNEHILRYAELIIYSSRTTTDDDITTSKSKALSTLSQLAEDICYSVPFFLDKHVWAKDNSKRGSSDLTMYGASAIIAPLSLATNEEWVSPEMYQWMIGQIHRIATETGVTRPGQYRPLIPSSSSSTTTSESAELSPNLNQSTTKKAGSIDIPLWSLTITGPVNKFARNVCYVRTYVRRGLVVLKSVNDERIHKKQRRHSSAKVDDKTTSKGTTTRKWQSQQPYHIQVLPYASKTVVVGGINVGLRREAARYHARWRASKLILAVRSVEEGNKVMRDIRYMAGIAEDAIEFWPLGQASYDSVLAFAHYVTLRSDRVEIFVANAGLAPFGFVMAEQVPPHDPVVMNAVTSGFCISILVAAHSVHADDAETETNKRFQQDCELTRNDSFVFSAEGQALQGRVCKELVQKLESIKPRPCEPSTANDRAPPQTASELLRQSHGNWPRSGLPVDSSRDCPNNIADLIHVSRSDNSPAQGRPRLRSSKTAPTPIMDVRVSQSPSQGGIRAMTRAESIPGFPGGDTQPMDTQVYRDYTTSMIRLSVDKTPIKTGADLNNEFSTHQNLTERSPHTYIEGDLGYVDLGLQWQRASPTTRSQGSVDIEELLENSPQTQSQIPAWPTRSSLPYTPSVAGNKHDRDGNTLTSQSATSKNMLAFSQLFGNGASKGPILSATQLFEQTQEPSSPMAGVPRSDPVVSRPSPNMNQNLSLSSPPPPTTSPFATMQRRLPSSARQARDTHASVRGSRSRKLARLRQESSVPEHGDGWAGSAEEDEKKDNGDDNDGHGNSVTRRYERLRARESLSKQAQNDWARIRAPSRDGSRPSSTRKSMAKTTIDLITPARDAQVGFD